MHKAASPFTLFLATVAIIKYHILMFLKNSLVLYKMRPAVITNIEDDKYVIKFYTSESESSNEKKKCSVVQKVRSKDICLLSDGPVASIEAVLSHSNETKSFCANIAEAHELLLSDKETATSPISFIELAGLINAALSPELFWALFKALLSSFEFTIEGNALKNGNIFFIPQSESAITSMKQKATEKEMSNELRKAFLKRLKEHSLDLPSDSRYMVEIEALALGKTDKSSAMKDAGIAETPQKAHRLLLDTGVWTPFRNPYPSRWGMSVHSASDILPSPPKEERIKVSCTSFAIDSTWSTDPDDAIAWDGTYLWVHVADPASTVMPESSIDIGARSRGATLYIPEGASRMLCENAIADYALGLNKVSYALSFRILLDENCAVSDCAVYKTIVDVKRLTYEEADAKKESTELKPLFDIARRNTERRKRNGAISVDLPEVHINIDSTSKKVSINPVTHLESMDMVREMMLLAGEGAAKFAFKNNIAFAYVGQDTLELPPDIPAGLAGQYKVLRCMKRRNVGVTPRPHAGLGLAMYSQVTSPLRRYGDLVSHEQLRAFMDNRQPLDSDAMLERISAGDEAARAGKKAEKSSTLHWTLVYLLQNPDWTGDAVCVDIRERQKVFLIPSLGQEAILSASKDIKLNDVIKVKAARIDIPTLSVTYMASF